MKQSEFDRLYADRRWDDRAEAGREADRINFKDPLPCGRALVVRFGRQYGLLTALTMDLGRGFCGAEDIVQPGCQDILI